MKIFRIISLSALGLFLLASTCYAWTIDNGINTGGGGAITAYDPSASPVAGTYTSSQSVVLSASDSSSIRYTVDGSSPSCISGTVYSSAITVSSTKTIKAIACYVDGDGTSASNIVSHLYTINIPSGGGGGGGGGGSTTYCSSVTYAAWGTCVGNLQTRSVLTSTPGGCTLTTNQQIEAQRACVLGEEPVITPPGTTPVITPVITPDSPVNVAAVMATERALVTKTNAALTNRLAGRILLQVEEKGEAWYVEPVSKQKYFMGRPADAFDMMRRFGLGISEANFSKFEKSGVPDRFAGRIFLRVENKGEAYYVNPVDMKMHYLGRPADAFNLMRELALGISNSNIRQIPVGEIK